MQTGKFFFPINLFLVNLVIIAENRIVLDFPVKLSVNSMKNVTLQKVSHKLNKLFGIKEWTYSCFAKATIIEVPKSACFGNENGIWWTNLFLFKTFFFPFTQ